MPPWPLHPEQQQLAERVHAALQTQISSAGGALPFDRYMELALYAPGIGYYVNGAMKFGAEGDFVTAPEISPLFSQGLANQCEQVLRQLGEGQILEFGAGSGAMAADILLHLQARDALPQRYLIVELSSELRARQRQRLQQTCPDLLAYVEWLDAPPQALRGVVLANEVLDAMPVSLFQRTASDWLEGFVVQQGQGFALDWGTPAEALRNALSQLEARVGPFAEGYCSEINLRLPAWMRMLSELLTEGAALLIDYGYSGAEYYHPERRNGTLICHFRQRAHDDPLALPGLQDITANVDFSAAAHAALDAGLELAGYTTQAHFLLDNGLDGLFVATSSDDADRHLQRLQELKRLTLPTEMGERFKVLGLQRGLDVRLQGFGSRDLRVYL